MELTGIHHLTAISAAIKENHRFYTQALGMRLVNRSVNQDDVSAYHLLVDDGGAGDPPAAWDRSPVPKEHQIRGLGPIVISIRTLNPTDALLTRVFNMRQARDCPHPDNPGTRVTGAGKSPALPGRDFPKVSGGPCKSELLDDGVSTSRAGSFSAAAITHRILRCPMLLRQYQRRAIRQQHACMRMPAARVSFLGQPASPQRRILW